MLNPITPTTKVVANGTQENPGYDDIRLAILDILAQSPDGYGYTGAKSLPVTPGQTISAQYWADLVDDLSVIWAHQNNNSLVLTNNLPQVGNRLTAALGNELVTKINAVDSVRYRRAPVGQRSVDGTTASTLPAARTWGGLLRHTAAMTWSSNLTANYFFNLGGRITFSVTYPFEVTYQDDNLSWKTLIDDYRADIGNLYYNKALFDNSDIGTVVTLGSYTRGLNTLSITAKQVNDHGVEFETKFANAGVATTLRVTSIISYEYSTGAITAPRPTVSVSHTLGDSYIAIIVPTRILTVSQPSTFSWQSGGTSNAQVITLTNIGNTRINVTGIDFVNDNNLTRITDFTGLGGSTSFSLDPDTSKQFTLAYSGSRLGDYTGSFTVRSNNTSGPVTRQLSQSVVNVPFDFTLTPREDPVYWNSRNTFSKTVTIVPSGTNKSFTSYTATSNLPDDGIFKIDTTFPTGPKISFNPSVLPPGLYIIIVTITVNNVSHYYSVTINFTAPLNEHLGSWTSALSPFNSVIGMSYDIIDGARYLTMGVGQGADGSSPTLSSSTRVDSDSALGFNGDSNYTAGPVLYPTTDRNWSGFLNGYGGWPSADLVSPAIIRGTFYISRTYYFRAPPGVYSYQYGVDNRGYVEVGNNLVIDRRAGGQDSYKNEWKGTMSLGNGLDSADPTLHKLVMYMQNDGGPAGVGLRITDSLGSEVWSTVVPRRDIDPYVNWAEVYRIKINATGVSQTVSSSDMNLYKTTGGQAQGAYTFGQAFQNASIITVKDKLGDGNLEITLNPLNPATFTTLGAYDWQTTAGNLSLAFYYYSTAEYYGRITQLDSGPFDGNRTRLFVGFNQSGQAQTRVVNLPTSLGTPPSPPVDNTYYG